MKKIEAIIQPFRLEPVKEALHAISVKGMTVAEVRASECKKASGKSTGAGIPGDFLPKVKIEIVATDDKVQSIVDTIISKARTGRIGDGKIFIYRWRKSSASAPERPGTRRFNSARGGGGDSSAPVYSA